MATLGSIENIKMEEYERIMKVNVTAPLNLTRLSVPHLIKTKGLYLLLIFHIRS